MRRLRERGAEVQVVMSAAAREFVTPTTFQAVSGRTVRSDLWDAAAEAAMGHIELARWADAVLIAPASADFLARLATGQADDLLATLCLATQAPVAVAPAMNHQMWARGHPCHIATLVARGVQGSVGEGDQAAEAAPGECSTARSCRACRRRAAGQRRRSLAGACSCRRTDARADRSSALHRQPQLREDGLRGGPAAREAGATVVLVAGPVSVATPVGVRRIDVESAADMLAAVLRELPGTDVFISTAAVADYRPARAAQQKIKKTTETMDLSMERTVDVLATVAAHAERPFVVGFAAETEAVEHNARTKLLKKNLDMIAANEVGHAKAFDCEDNELLVLSRGARHELARAGKLTLARGLIGLIAQDLAARHDVRSRGTALA